MEYVIRECENRDIDQLVQLCHEHAIYELANYDPAGKASSISEALFIAPCKLHCLVVEYKQDLIGYCSYTIDYSTWDAKEYLHMDCLYLSEHCRGKGIGRLLIEKLYEIAKERDYINVQWQTPVFNVEAIKFYSKLGAIAKEKQRFFLAVV